MNSKKFLPLIASAAILWMGSCSGLKTPCTTNCGGGGGGNATVIVTMRATPLTPQASTNLLAFVTTLTGVSFTPSGGGSSPGINNTTTVDFARLQSDSLLIGTATLPAGSYTGITMGFSAPTVTYCLRPTPGIQGCIPGSTTTLTGSLSSPQIPLTLTVAGNQVVGLEIDLNAATALTISNQVVSAVNLGATSAFTESSLPPASSSLGSGQLDFVENIVGVVTQISGSTVTVQTSNNGTYTATGTSSTYFVPTCLLTNVACAPAAGQLVSIDAAIKSDGTLTLLTYDPLSSTEVDWVEGVVTTVPTSSTQFQIVAGQQATSMGGASNLPSGAIANVTLSNPSPFVVDAQGFPTPANSFENATDATSILPGMTVGLHVTLFTAASGTTPAAITADMVALRFSNVSGSVALVSPPNTFSIQSVPIFFGLSTNSVVQLGTATQLTNFDGVSSASGLQVGGTVAMRALYLGPSTNTPFVAAKVRAF